MQPTDVAGRSIAPAPDDAGERRPGEWQPIGAVVRRVLKGSIVAAGMNGHLSRKKASGLIETLGLRHV